VCDSPEAHLANEDFHIALVGDRTLYLMPLKRALLSQSALASHWSTSHTDYSSTLRYGCKASPSKQEVSLDPPPLLWCGDGQHRPLPEACREPSTAVATLKRRWKSEQAASEQAKEEPRPTDLHIWPLVIRHNVRNNPERPEAHLELLQVAIKCCSPAMVSYLFKMRQKLPARIDDLWLFEEIDAGVAHSKQMRMDALLEAVPKLCLCAGQWPAFMTTTLQISGIDPLSIAHDIYNSFRHGPCESVPTIVLAALQGGKGKLLMWAPLTAALGKTMSKKVGLGNKKAVILNEWHFNIVVRCPTAHSCYGLKATPCRLSGHRTLMLIMGIASTQAQPPSLSRPI